MEKRVGGREKSSHGSNREQKRKKIITEYSPEKRPRVTGVAEEELATKKIIIKKHLKVANFANLENMSKIEVGRKPQIE